MITRVCHSRESGNPCVFASLMDSRFRGNDRKLNSPDGLFKYVDLQMESCYTWLGFPNDRYVTQKILRYPKTGIEMLSKTKN